MSKSALYAVNSNAQTVAIGSAINFGTPVRRFGCNIQMEEGTVNINGLGYYCIDNNIVFEGTEAGDANITLYKDGVIIPGAVASITTVAGSSYSVNIPCIVRHKCCCNATITAVVTGCAIGITCASIEVVKL